MIDQISSPQPPFGLWQPVILSWTDDEGQTRTDKGIVTGVLYKTPEFPNCCWVFQVLWYELPDSSWLQLPHVEFAAGEDLTPDPLPPAQPPQAACDYLRQVWDGLSRP
jgi:hypothetical protein